MAVRYRCNECDEMVVLCGPDYMDAQHDKHDMESEIPAVGIAVAVLALTSIALLALAMC